MKLQPTEFTAVSEDAAEWSPAAGAVARHAFVNLLGLAVYYLAAALFMYPDVVNIGVMRENRVVVAAFGVLPYPDIALGLVIGYALFFDQVFRANVQSKAGSALLTFLFIYACVGVLLGNEIGWVRTDLRIWAWGFGGLAMLRIVMKMRRPTLHILALCLLGGVILFGSAISIKSQMEIGQAMENSRVWDLNVFSYAGFMLPLLGLVFTLVTLRGFLSFCGAVLAFGLYFVGAVLIGATRSLAMALVVVALSASVSLLFRRAGGQITNQFSSRAFWIGLLTVVGALAIVGALAGVAFSDSTVLGDRFSDDKDINSGTDRLVELQDGLQQLGVLKSLVGGGLGYTFESIFNYTSNFLHITIFTFLMKFGALPFVAIVVFLYLVLPLKFLQSFFRPATLPPSTRTALLIVLPSVFGWVTILTMSGGYDMYYALGIGMAAGVFAEIKANGLNPLCP